MARLKQKLKDLEWWEWACLLLFFPIIVPVVAVYLLACCAFIALITAMDLLSPD